MKKPMQIMSEEDSKLLAEIITKISNSNYSQIRRLFLGKNKDIFLKLKITKANIFNCVKSNFEYKAENEKLINGIVKTFADNIHYRISDLKETAKYDEIRKKQAKARQQEIKKQKALEKKRMIDKAVLEETLTKEQKESLKKIFSIKIK